jgi:hypothetical protein
MMAKQGVWRRASRNLARNILESAFTGSKKFFLAGSQVCPSEASPPPGTRWCTCGW